MNNEKFIQERRLYACPHCENPNFIKHGKEEGIQRYKCKKCNKTFRATTGTSVHYLHKKKLVANYIQTMREGLSVRKAAIRLAISPKTAFIWRHKFLASLSQSNITEQQNNINGKGIKIIKLPYSDKGRRKSPELYTKQSISLIIEGGGRTTIAHLPPFKHVKKASFILKELQNSLVAEVPNKILKHAIDKSGKTRLNRKTQAYTKLKNEVELKTEDLIYWMAKFQGVATKYLHHYWSWYSTINNIKTSTHSQELFYGLCTESRSREEFFQTLNK